MNGEFREKNITDIDIAFVLIFCFYRVNNQNRTNYGSDESSWFIISLIEISTIPALTPARKPTSVRRKIIKATRYNKDYLKHLMKPAIRITILVFLPKTWNKV